MTEKDIEARYKKAVENATPDVFDSVLSKCNERKVITMTANRNNGFKKFLAIAAAFAIVLAAGIGIGITRANTAIDSVIALDVNPSIELDINRKDRVIEARALNADGEKILGEMSLEKTDLDVAVNAIIGSMLKNGYIDKAANSILVSVDNDDKARGEELQKRISNEISAILGNAEIEGAVISQLLAHDKESDSRAKEYGISEGKAQLISEIVKTDSRYDFEDLIGLSVNELNLITSSGDTLVGASASGKASEANYIGREKAIDIAIAHANADKSLASIKCDLDYENGVMVYEVEIDVIKDKIIEEYDYDINALDGSVIKFEKDIDNIRDEVIEKPLPKPVEGRSDIISADDAKKAAIAHAGAVEADIYGYESKLDREDGRLVYEVEFKYSGYEYDYEIDAQSAAVIKSDKDADDDRHEERPEERPSTPSLNETISAEDAKSIALSHAGVSRNDARELECELDREGGRLVYEVEFKSKGYEYDYEINAQTSEIIKSNKEIDD